MTLMTVMILNLDWKINISPFRIIRFMSGAKTISDYEPPYAFCPRRPRGKGGTKAVGPEAPWDGCDMLRLSLRSRTSVIHECGFFFMDQWEGFLEISGRVRKIWTVPSGKRLHNYGKSPFSVGKFTINGPFSIAKSMVNQCPRTGSIARYCS